MTGDVSRPLTDALAAAINRRRLTWKGGPDSAYDGLLAQGALDWLSSPAVVGVVTDTLAEHAVVGWGMSGDSPNECKCGERVYPAPEAFEMEPMRARRDRASAAHQWAAVVARIGGSA